MSQGDRTKTDTRIQKNQEGVRAKKSNISLELGKGALGGASSKTRRGLQEHLLGGLNFENL